MCPAFTVVVPAYNVAPYVGETIASVLAQDEPDWQAVIVDDGSSDGISSVLAGFDDPRIEFVRQGNAGLNKARKAGADRALGRYIVFLDGDDRLRPDALSRFRRVLENRPSFGVVHGDRVLMDETGVVFGTERGSILRRRLQGEVGELVLVRNPFTTPSQCAIRASALARAGGYPIDCRASADWYLWCLLAMVTSFGFVAGGPVVEYRLRRRSLARQWVDQGVDVHLPAHIAELTPILDAIHAAPLIRERVGGRRLDKLRRGAEAHAFAVKGYEFLRAGSWSLARTYLLTSLRMRPHNLTACLCLGLAVGQVMPRSLVPYIGEFRSSGFEGEGPAAGDL
jgi:glycosyltransferase involved in cell wall biosynthesis